MEPPPSRHMPRFHRRKEDRPGEIAEAALDEFEAHGYAATRVEDVARRAGVSKGLMYLYYRTKEELFKAVVRNVVLPRIDKLQEAIAASDLSAEALMRGPMLDFMKNLVGSRARVVIRLLIAEGPKHPDLTAFYADNVIGRGMETIRAVIERGVERGEFRPTAVIDMPQIVVAPALLALVWQSLFQHHRPLDSDKLLETHIDLLLSAIRAPDIAQRAT